MADLINQFIDPAGFNQLNEAIALLEKMSSEIDAINAQGIQLTGATAGSGDLRTLMQNINAVTASVEKLNATVTATNAALANMKAPPPPKPPTEAISAYKQLVEQSKNANAAAKELAITEGMQSEAFKVAAAEAKNLSAQLRNINESVGESTAASAGFMSALNGIWGTLRKIAYIIPGLGIAGIMNILFEGISKLGSLMGETDAAASKLGMTTKEYNELLKEQHKATADATVNLHELSKEFYDGNTSIERRKQITNELNDKYGDLVGGVKSLNDADAVFKDKQADIIEIMGLRAKATMLTKQAVDKLTEAQSDELAGSLETLWAGFKGFFTDITKGYDFSASAAGKAAKEATNWWTKQRQIVTDNNKAQNKKDAENLLAEVDKVNAQIEAKSKHKPVETEGDKEAADAAARQKKINDKAAAENEKAALKDRLLKQKLKEEEAAARQNEVTQLTAASKKQQDERFKDEVNINTKSLQNQTEFAKKQEKIDDDATKKKKKKDEDDAAHQKELWKQVYSELEDLAKQATQAFFDLENQKLEKQIKNFEVQKKLINDRLALELNAIDLSMESDLKKQHDKAELNAQALAQQQSIDRKIAEAKRKQAINDKMAAIAAVVENTAIAVSKVWGETGLPAILLQALPIAMGAIQIANIMATPIPQFFKGTKSSPEGLAWVGERGTEMYVTPEGKLGFTPDEATLTYLKAGTQIIPHDQTMEIAKSFAANERLHSGDILDGRLLDAINRGNKELLQSNRDLIRAIKNKEFKQRDVNFDLYLRSKTGRL